MPISALSASPEQVGALGYIEPEGGVIRLSGPVGSAGAALSELLIEEGQHVTAGQPIAYLDNRARLAAALKRAKARVAIAVARLNHAKAGAKTGTVNAQKARIARLQVELETASSECRRFKKLGNNRAVAKSTLDQKCLEERVFRGRLVEATARLAEIVEVRDVDIAIADAERLDAEANVEQAEVDLGRSVVLAPIAGQILAVHTKLGELISPKGIVELGQTKRMQVSAEVYETDIGRIAVGQAVLISADGLPSELRGTVNNVGLKIGRNAVLAPDPTADVDARVVKVEISLNQADSAKVARLTNMQVRVAIEAATAP